MGWCVCLWVKGVWHAGFSWAVCVRVAGYIEGAPPPLYGMAVMLFFVSVVPLLCCVLFLGYLSCHLCPQTRATHIGASYSALYLATLAVGAKLTRFAHSFCRYCNDSFRTDS